MTDCYVGLMSGTSMDGIDAVVASFAHREVQIHATHMHEYPPQLKADLLTAIREPLSFKIDPDGALNRAVGMAFRDAARVVRDKCNLAGANIKAIGSHGQTLRHQPNIAKPFSLQVGDPDIIARGCNLTTVANFRSADIAAGGQGAPLVPPFHEWLFRSTFESQVVVNIGGIGNITYLPSDDSDVTGFDTGPGNGLMDVWIRKNRALPFDEDGTWAASGNVIAGLLERFLEDSYFSLPPPKSTGFEYFNPAWLEKFPLSDFAANDVQATLCELTAVTINTAIRHHANDACGALVCGGGAQNQYLMRRLRATSGGLNFESTAVAGLDPAWVEAAAFAWLAMRTINGQTGNLPSVTGASHKVVLGDIHSPDARSIHQS